MEHLCSAALSWPSAFAIVGVAISGAIVAVAAFWYAAHL